MYSFIDDTVYIIYEKQAIFINHFTHLHKIHRVNKTTKIDYLLIPEIKN